jgi:hypothetical protein
MPDVQCPVCGNYTSEGRFCEHCGSSLIPVPANNLSRPSAVSGSQPQTKKRSAIVTLLLIIGTVFLIFIILSAIITAFVIGMAGNIDTTKSTYGTPSIITATPTYFYSTSATGTQSYNSGVGTLSITTYPGCVQVFINGQYNGITSGCNIGGSNDAYNGNLVLKNVNSGSFYVELKKSGYLFESQSFTLNKGGVVTISKTLTRVPVRQN